MEKWELISLARLANPLTHITTFTILFGIYEE
jgi:hypothetical protein